MQKKFHIKKGDTVRVMSGESKGQEGKVIEIITKEDRAIVEGANIVSKHSKKVNAKNPQDGGIVKKEAPIHVSNLMLIDASGKPTRIGRKVNAEGKKVRYSKKSGEEIK